jgi:nucleoid-associated protein YgaU
MTRDQNQKQNNPRPSAKNLRSSAVQEDQETSHSVSSVSSGPVLSEPSGSVEGAKKKRGGKRPGAGAPKGNLNALKHGRRSRQFAEIGALIAEVPGVGQSLRALAGRRDTRRRRDEETATEAVIALYRHAKDIAAGVDSPGPFRHLLRSNDGLNAPPKALSAPQSKQRRQILNAALAEIADDWEKTQHLTANNQPLTQQSNPTNETPPD